MRGKLHIFGWINCDIFAKTSTSAKYEANMYKSGCENNDQIQYLKYKGW